MSDNKDSESTSFGEVLILDKIGSSTSSVSFLALCSKNVVVVDFPKAWFSNQAAPVLYGSKITARCKKIDGKQKRLVISSGQKAIGVDTLKLVSQKKLEVAEQKHESGRCMLECSALTTGCFTFEDVDFSSPSAFSNLLGILTDLPGQNNIPANEIGRLRCLVVPEKVDNVWRMCVHTVKKFEPVGASIIQNSLRDGEHFGLVTRVEGDISRDLRLISTRDFPRDVRFFGSANNHRCDQGRRHAQETAQSADKNANLISPEAPPKELLGVAVAVKVRRCRGIGLGFGPAGHERHIDGEHGGIGFHVDGTHFRRAEQQLHVHVHGGFVEVETVCEYLGYTDHNNFPLLWSHDLEFIIDFTKVFESKPTGIYVVNAVRFHRSNVFAKWRLARRTPIVRALGKIRTSNSSHSVNLASLGVGTADVCRMPVPIGRSQNFDVNQDFSAPLQNVFRQPYSMSYVYQRRPASVSLMEHSDLFEALQASISLCQSPAPLAEPVMLLSEVEEIDEAKSETDDAMWQHINDAAQSICEENDDGPQQTRYDDRA